MPSIEVYDPTNDTWTFLRNMSSPRMGARGAVVNGEILIIGGHAGPPYPRPYGLPSERWLDRQSTESSSCHHGHVHPNIESSAMGERRASYRIPSGRR